MINDREHPLEAGDRIECPNCRTLNSFRHYLDGYGIPFEKRAEPADGKDSGGIIYNALNSF
jgi:hypothetical protein